MSLSIALSNALSGLGASSRRASVTSANIANALTEGYARRSLETSPRYAFGGGVTVDGVQRHADPALIAERRGVISDLAGADTRTSFHKRLESLFGTPDDSHALTSLYAGFETALVSAASRPDLPERLDLLLGAAEDVTRGFARLQDGIQTMRSEADAEIGATVTRLNALLGQVADLNQAIEDARNTNGDTASLQDLRQRAVDEIAEYVPVRTVPRNRDSIALFTPGGTILVDGSAAALSFTRTHTITPHQTLANGFLSGLEVNGTAVDPGVDGPLSGGKLAALFQLRDDLGVTAQSQLDAAARDLVERYQDAGLDATRAPGDPGLFTDGGLAFAVADEIGLAGRIAINPSADPDQGGATWRLRAGLGAAVPGELGDSSLLQDMIAALTGPRTPASGDFGTGQLNATGIASSLLSGIATDRYLAEDRLTFASARHGEVEARYLSDGVDTDEEMQRLLLIEQAYAANARMVRTIDEMMNTLLGL